MPVPDWNSFIYNSWAPGGSGVGGSYPFPQFVTNVVIGCNPPYYPADFLAVFPKFGGPPSNLAGATTISSNIVTGVDITGLSVGNYVVGAQLTDGSVITALGSNQITLSQPALATVNPAIVTVYPTPFVPSYVIGLYCTLASSHLVYNRWNADWYMGMAYFIAHFCTLYAQADSDTYLTAAQAATAGLSKGIATSKSAGGVSIGYQPMITGSEDWAQWQLTTYGQRFISMAKCIGAGMILLY